MQLSDYLNYLEKIKRRHALELASKTKFQLEVQAKIESLGKQLEQAKKDKKEKLPKELEETHTYYHTKQPANFLNQCEKEKEDASYVFTINTSRFTRKYKRDIESIKKSKSDAEKNYIDYRKKSSDALSKIQQRLITNILCSFTLLDRKFNNLFEQQHEETLARLKQCFKKEADLKRPLTPEQFHQNIFNEIKAVVKIDDTFQDLNDPKIRNKLIPIIDANEEEFNKPMPYPYLRFKNIRQFLKQGYLDADYSSDKPESPISNNFLTIEKILIDSPTVTALFEQLNAYCTPEQKTLLDKPLSEPKYDSVKEKLTQAADKAKFSTTNLLRQAGNTLREQWHKHSNNQILIDCITSALDTEYPIDKHKKNDREYAYWSNELTACKNDLIKTTKDYKQAIAPHEAIKKENTALAEMKYNQSIEDAKEMCKKVKINKIKNHDDKINKIKIELDEAKKLNPAGQIETLEKNQLKLLKRQTQAAFTRYEKIYEGYCFWHSKAKGWIKAESFYNKMNQTRTHEEAIATLFNFFSDKDGNYSLENTMRNHSFKTYLLKELFNENGGSFSLQDGNDMPTFEMVKKRIDKGLDIYKDNTDLTKIVTTGCIFKTIKGNTPNLFQFRRSSKARSATARNLHQTLHSSYTPLQQVT